ncbi:ATP-binding protein [Rhodanobacter sp. Col0626]|uniref:sensor histidine kinase n=1 Tax=Rhodanobacter sp. Col0626 TaxID=3415679 RepID=UPI003CEE74A1
MGIIARTIMARGAIAAQRLMGWLNRVPISDPVDRRNAAFLQIFLLYKGCVTPLYKAYMLRFTSVYDVFRPGHSPTMPHHALAIDLSTDVLVTVSAWLGIYLIRKGLFRHAVSQFLAAMVASSLISYVSFGYFLWNADLVSFEALALSGLMLGRKALWSIYPLFMLSYASGMTVDYFHNARFLHSSSAYAPLPFLVLSYLLVVVILDRSSTALRESLAESNRHRQQLQDEMAERERTREQLLQSQKMDAVGKLASGVAHDFNNVLGIVLGFALERHRLDEPGAARSEDALALAKALQGVEMAARRGASVSRKLLNFSRREVTHVETFDVAEALRELQPLLRQLLPAQVTLRIDAPWFPLLVDFDRSQFELALLNLASNARDAMPDGGEFGLSVEREGSDIGIVVRDNGTGMSDEVRQRIFEPFYTTKPAGSGTGLGLAVVYTLVERAGGHIEVDASPGTGTTFHIRLPMVDRPVADLVPSLAGPDEIHVMLIDDDDDLRNLLCTALQNGGCRVSTAASGADAERMAEQIAFDPQVLVCDNRLGDTDGTTLLLKLRQRMPRIPTILISAYLDTDGRSPNPADPLTERLPKPFSPNDLLARVIGAARRHAAQNHPPDQTTIST